MSVLTKNFIFSEKIEEVLDLGFLLEKNVVLYGPGGHAKSAMVEEYFAAHKIETFTKCVGQGTKIEDLFGGIDMKVLTEHGRIEYLVENSFMAHETVVIEEIFDMPLSVLEQLKDVLMSGIFRNGNQIYKLKTKFIVGLTNKSKDEIADDDSIKAATERFPLDLRVAWDSYGAKAYNLMFKKVTGNSMEKLSMIVEEANKYTFISPRTAIVAASVFKEKGFEGLQFVQGFDNVVLEKIRERYNELEEHAKQQKYYDTCYKEWNLIYNDETTNINVLKTHMKKLNGLVNDIRNYSFNDSIYNNVNALVKDCGTTISRIKERIIDNI